jgi:hypothetical protein
MKFGVAFWRVPDLSLLPDYDHATAHQWQLLISID